jgi:trk system potassium uptake protein TrkH
MPERKPSAQQRLGAARLLGAGAISILAQFAVDMPGRYFGPPDEITEFGALFSSFVGLLVILGVYGYLSRRRWANEANLVLASLSIGAFIPPLTSDPVVSGAVILWHFSLLGRWLFPSETASIQRTTYSPQQDPVSMWLEMNGPATSHLAITSLIATTAVVGYRIGARVPAQAVCLVLALLVLALTTRLNILLIRRRRRGPYVAGVFLIAALLSYSHPSNALSFLAGYQAAMLIVMGLETPMLSDILDFFFDKPASMIAASFVLLIALGTLFLSFPISAASGQSISPIDAIFTATSATCVTGLIVLDTATDFSRFGQLVILLLIQLGALNIMVFSSFASLVLFGQRPGIRGERALGEVLGLPLLGSAQRLVAFIVLTTLVIEGAGTAYLTYAYSLRGLTLVEASWRGAFHAVSAFCNAGFSLQSDSLIPFQKQPTVLVVVAILVILGGLGFAVLGSWWARLWGSHRRSVSVQVRIVLVATAFLIVIATLGYTLTEWSHSLSGLHPSEKLANAFFQAVTPRTAGFNSVDLSALQPVTWLLLMVLMFIGASPGGTGGGIKTTTAVVLIGAIPAIIRGESRVILFGHTLPLETIYRSAAITVITLMLLLTALSVLLATHNIPFHILLFEVVSAMGTVGLSLGATPQLNLYGKLVIILVMFVGRVGPLTLALLLGRKSRTHIGYPEAKIMIG